MVVIALAHVEHFGELDRVVYVVDDVAVDSALVFLADTGWAIFFALVGPRWCSGLGCAVCSGGVETNKAAAGLVDVVFGSWAAQATAAATLLGHPKTVNAAVGILEALRVEVGPPDARFDVALQSA